MHRRFEKEAKERGLEFVDLNCDLDRIGIDWKNDFYDKGDHVNVFGAEKITAYLGEYVLNEFDLEDHRGDPAYQLWDEMIAKYEQELIDMKGTDYFILEDQAGIQHQIRALSKMDNNK